MRTLVCHIARKNVWRRVAVSPDGYAAAYRHRITGQIVVLHEGMRP